MARDTITKHIKSTQVHATELDAAGAPQEIVVSMARTFRTEDAAKSAARKQHNGEIIVTGVYVVEQVYTMSLADFIAAATVEGDTAEGNEPVAEGETAVGE